MNSSASDRPRRFEKTVAVSRRAWLAGLLVTGAGVVGPRGSVAQRADRPPRGAATGWRPPVTALAFSPDGRWLVSGSQGGLAIHDAETLQICREIAVTMDQVHALAFSSDGDRLAVAGGDPGETGRLEWYATETWDRLTSLTVGDDSLFAVAPIVAADGVAPGNPGRVRAADPAADPSADPSAVPSAVPAGGPAAVPAGGQTGGQTGGRWLVASADESAYVIAGGSDVDGDGARPELAFRGHSGPVLAGCVLPDMETAVTGGRDQTLRVWDLRDGSRVRDLHQHTGPVVRLRLRPAVAARPSAALPMVASASDDRTVRLWQPTIGRMVRFVRLPSVPLDIAWAADGTRLLATCADGRIWRIDPETAALETLAETSDPRPQVIAVAPHQPRGVYGGRRGRCLPFAFTSDPKPELP